MYSEESPDGGANYIFFVGIADEIEELQAQLKEAEQTINEQKEAIEEQVKLIELIHKDLKMRADDDSVVNISSFIWCKINEALKVKALNKD